MKNALSTALVFGSVLLKPVKANFPAIGFQNHTNNSDNDSGDNTDNPDTPNTPDSDGGNSGNSGNSGSNGNSPSPSPSPSPSNSNSGNGDGNGTPTTIGENNSHNTSSIGNGGKSNNSSDGNGGSNDNGGSAHHDDASDGSGHGLHGGSIAGVVLGCIVATGLLLLLYLWWRRRRQRLAQARTQRLSSSATSALEPSIRTAQDIASPASVPAILTPSFPSPSSPTYLSHDFATPFIFTPSTARGEDDAAHLEPLLGPYSEMRGRTSALLPNPYDQAFAVLHDSRTSRELPPLPSDAVTHSGSSGIPSVSSSRVHSDISAQPQAGTSSANRVSVLHEELATHQKELEARFEEEVAAGVVQDPPPTYLDTEGDIAATSAPGVDDD